MKKRILAILLVAVMVLTLVVPALAVDAEIPTSGVCGYEGDNITWSVQNGVLTIGGNGMMSDLARYQQVPAWYDHRETITSAVINEGVVNLGGRAFYGCSALANVSIAGSVTSIGASAFEGCKSLTSVSIPSGVIGIGAAAFQDCKNLTSITIPGSVTIIGLSAFQGTGLTDIYYGGSQVQWNVLESDELWGSTADRSNVTIHYNSTDPDQPAKDVAHASAQTVTVDGKPVEFQMYALKDANGNDTNYIKLRDMAYVLNGTKAQFSVCYNAQDKTITATTGAAYEEDGTEMKATFGGADKEYVKTTLTIQLDGKPVQLEAITLTDDAGGGYNYCMVRDLGKTFNFNVDWNAGVGIYIESDKPYGG